MQHQRVLYSRKRLGTLRADIIASSIEELIAVLDEREGDLDLEECGLEDSFMLHAADGPGDSCADGGEIAYTEWHTRGPRKLYRGGYETQNDHGRWHEDEEDDEGGGDTSGDEGEPNFAKRPGSGAGCMISDPDYGAEELGELEMGR